VYNKTIETRKQVSKMTTIRVMSDGYTINTKKVLKVFKNFFVKKLERAYGSGYEII
jgi:hypothetical protein